MVEFIQQVLNGLGLGASYSLLAIGLALLLGVGRVGNFAHGDIAMAGGYTLQISMVAGATYVLASFGATIIAAFLSWMAYRLVFRYLVESRNTHIVFLGSMALSTVLSSAALLIFDGTPREVKSPLSTMPLLIGPFVMSGPRWFAALVASLVVVGLVMFLRYTDTGRKIRAVGQSREAAQIVGIDPNATLAMTFVVAGLMAGISAMLLAPIISVTPTMGLGLMLKGFAIVIMGGMSSLVGAFVMSMIVGVSESLTVGYLASDFADGAVFFLLIVFLLFRPTGLTKLSEIVRG